MKKTILSIALACTYLLSYSQESYTVKMNMKIEGLPAEYAAMGDQETTTYIKGEKNKTEVVGMMGSQTMLFDGKTHTILMDQMGNKSGYTATKEEMDETKDKSAPKPKVEYTSEKKMIAGFECTKAIVTSLDKEKKENKMFVWVTDKIKSDPVKRRGGRGMMDLGDLKGYPLEMEIKQSQQGTEMKISIVATDVSTSSIDDSVFKANTEGYKMSSYKEFKEKMKGTGER